MLLGLADEFGRDGFVAKAVAVLKRIEKLEPGRKDVESRLGRLVHQQQEAAPLVKAAPPPEVLAEGEPPSMELEIESGPAPLEAASRAPAEGLTDGEFDEELVVLAEDVVRRTPAPADARARTVAFAERLLACDLFRSVPEEELLAIVRALKLRSAEPGEVILAEGEPGEGLFVIATGGVKVFIANPSGRNVPVARLGEGQYFGEIASLSGRPRTATVIAAPRCAGTSRWTPPTSSSPPCTGWPSAATSKPRPSPPPSTATASTPMPSTRQRRDRLAPRRNHDLTCGHQRPRPDRPLLRAGPPRPGTGRRHRGRRRERTERGRRDARLPARKRLRCRSARHRRRGHRAGPAGRRAGHRGYRMPRTRRDPWADHDVEVVVEASGHFRSRAAAAAHLVRGQVES